MESKKQMVSHGGRDGLSNLPDAVLHHIFSFLDTRAIVQSSVLSTRWRDLWTSMPYLNFDDREFHVDGQFERFVDMVLWRHDTSGVLSFSLTCLRYLSEFRISRWILQALRRNVRVLKIKVNRFHYIDFFPCIYTCQSLEELSLTQVAPTVPEVVSLGRLKRLRLHLIEFCNGFMEKLIPECPVLEALDLSGCTIYNMDISSCSLNSLTIRYCQIHGPLFRITCSSLKFLCYTDYYGLRFKPSLENLSSLGNASLHYWVTREYDDGAISLVQGLSNAKALELFSSAFESLSEKGSSLIPTFNNLKRLKLGGFCLNKNMLVVGYFLQHTPNLETLTLVSTESLQSCSDDNMEEEIEQLGKMSFHCPHLHTVKIQCYDKNERVDELVEILKSNAEALKELAIGN